jgi:hypothetical protein
VGTIGSRECLSELLLLAKQARIELATSPVFTGALSRSKAHLHHTGISCGGNQRPRCFAIALPIELQQLAPLAGFEPATAGAMYPVPSPRRKLFKSLSLPPYLFTSFFGAQQ